MCVNKRVTHLISYAHEASKPASLWTMRMYASFYFFMHSYICNPFAYWHSQEWMKYCCKICHILLWLQIVFCQFSVVRIHFTYVSRTLIHIYFRCIAHRKRHQLFCKIHITVALCAFIRIAFCIKQSPNKHFHIISFVLNSGHNREKTFGPVSGSNPKIAKDSSTNWTNKLRVSGIRIVNKYFVRSFSLLEFSGSVQSSSGDFFRRLRSLVLNEIHRSLAFGFVFAQLRPFICASHLCDIFFVPFFAWKLLWMHRNRFPLARHYIRTIVQEKQKEMIKYERKNACEPLN